MSKLIKNNKIIIGVVGLLLVLIVVVFLFGHKKETNQGISGEQQSQQTQINDIATGDNTAESLNALTEELRAVVNKDNKLQAHDTKLKQENAKILQNIKQEVQQNLETELKNRGRDNKAEIEQLQEQLKKINQALKNAQNNQSGFSGNSAVNGQTEQFAGASVINLNGERLIAVPDLASGTSAGVEKVKECDTSGTFKSDRSDAILHSGDTHQTNTEIDNKEIKPTPFYTIPSGATLARSVTMTSLIGRVPVNGVVKSPYPFKMIIGTNNMAANGLHIPNINGAIVQGYTVGDMALHCVKGYITAMTFVFSDGTISTTKMQSNSDNSNLGFNDALGYISEPNGNPCFSGKFYTNAPTFLTTMVALGALNQGGQAYALAQQTAMSNASGGTTTSLTGSVGKYMLGGAVAGGTQQVMDWYTQREKNSFDAVYVPAGKKAVINITKQIAINHDPNGRKIYYEHTKNSSNNTSLD